MTYEELFALVDVRASTALHSTRCINHCDLREGSSTNNKLQKKTAPLKRAACAETLRKPNVMLIMPNVMLIMPYVTQIQDVAYILRLSVR